MSFIDAKPSFESSVSLTPSYNSSDEHSDNSRLSSSAPRRSRHAKHSSSTNSSARIGNGEKNEYDATTAAPIDIKKNASSTNSHIRVGKGSPNEYDPSTAPAIVVSHVKGKSSTNGDVRLAAMRERSRSRSRDPSANGRSPSPAASLRSTHSRIRTSISSMVDNLFIKSEENEVKAI